MGIKKKDLNPCPWCGAGMAAYAWVGGFYTTTDESESHSYDCPLRVNDNHYGEHDRDHKSKSYNTLEQAVCEWNKPPKELCNLIEAVKKAYKKHAWHDDAIGWDELSDILRDALCNALGDIGYLDWVEQENKDTVA